MDDSYLMTAIEKALGDLEENNEIVICSATSRRSAKHIYEAVSALVPSGLILASELRGLRLLVSYAVNDKRFFDWEMPTLTGFSADEFNRIAEKLPKE